MPRPTPIRFPAAIEERVEALPQRQDFSRPAVYLAIAKRGLDAIEKELEKHRAKAKKGPLKRKP